MRGPRRGPSTAPARRRARRGGPRRAGPHPGHPLPRGAGGSGAPTAGASPCAGGRPGSPSRHRHQIQVRHHEAEVGVHEGGEPFLGRRAGAERGRPARASPAAAATLARRAARSPGRTGRRSGGTACPCRRPPPRRRRPADGGHPAGREQLLRGRRAPSAGCALRPHARWVPPVGTRFRSTIRTVVRFTLDVNGLRSVCLKADRSPTLQGARREPPPHLLVPAWHRL